MRFDGYDFGSPLSMQHRVSTFPHVQLAASVDAYDDDVGIGRVLGCWRTKHDVGNDGRIRVWWRNPIHSYVVDESSPNRSRMTKSNFGNMVFNKSFIIQSNPFIDFL